MATEKKYIVRLENGEELPPSEPEVLIKLAEAKTITPGAMVRHQLIPGWEKAGNVDFLKAIIFKQQQENLVKQAHSKSGWEKFKEQVTLVAPQLEERRGAVKVNLETLPPARPMARLLAGAIDLIILAIVSTGLFFGGKACISSEVFEGGTCVCLTCGMIVTVVVLYYALMIGLCSQTLGQRFFGVFMIRTNGKPFWIGRVFFYALFLMPFFVFSPVFLLIGAKTFPELITCTRMAKALADRK